MVLPALGLNRAGVIARLPAWDPRVFWAALALVAAILLGASIIAWTDRWRSAGAGPLRTERAAQPFSYIVRSRGNQHRGIQSYSRTLNRA